MAKKKLYILLIFSNLMVTKLLNSNRLMHNLYTIYVNIINMCKTFSKGIVNEHGNIFRVGVVPRLSDIEVVTLSLTVESLSIDIENYLFSKLKEYDFQLSNAWKYLIGWIKKIGSLIHIIRKSRKAHWDDILTIIRPVHADKKLYKTNGRCICQSNWQNQCIHFPAIYQLH